MTGKVFLTTVLMILLAIALIIPACQDSQQADGTLQGTVTIGPIWPVERPGENPPVPPQVFEARNIIIYNKSQTKVLKKVNLHQIDNSASARFAVQLNPGC